MEGGGDDKENEAEQGEEWEEGGEQEREDESEGSSTAAAGMTGSLTGVEGGWDATTSIIMVDGGVTCTIFA